MNGVNWHDLRRCWRDILPLALVGMSVLLFLIPFGTAGVPGDSIFDLSVTHEQMKYRLIGDAFLPAVQACAVLFGFLAGLFTFRFLLEPGRASAVFSLPLSRKTLYLGRIVTGLVSLAGGILIPLTISLALNLAALGQHHKLISAWLLLFLGIFATAAVAFIIASIGASLAGNMAEAVFFSTALLIAPFAFSYGANTYLKHLLWGNPFGVTPYLGDAVVMPPLTELLAPFNPVLFFYGDLSLHRMFYRPFTTDVPPVISPGLTVSWLGACILLAIIGYICFTRRRAEQAGFPGKNSFMTRVCAFIPTIIVCSLAFDIAAESSLSFGIALLIVVFTLCVVLWERTIPGEKESGAFFKKRALPVGVFTSLMLVLVIGAGAGYGMFAFLPPAGSIVSVSVSFVGSPNTLGIPALGSSTTVGYYTAASYTYAGMDEISTAIRLHEMIDSSGRRPMAFNDDDFTETVVPYDVMFAYTMKDGKTKTWYYDRASLAELDALLVLEDTQVAQLGVRTVLGGESSVQGTVYAREAFLRGDIYLADMTYRDVFALILPAEWRGELLKCFREDTAAQSIGNRYFPDGEPLAVMMFTFSGGNDVKTFSYHLNNAFIYLHEDTYPRAIAFLRANELWFDETQTDLAASTDPAAVETLILQEYNPYIGMNKPTFPQSLYFMSYLSAGSNDFRVVKDFGKTNEVRDPAQIAGILPRLRSDYFLSESGSLAAVKYVGSEKWVYKFVPE